MICFFALSTLVQYRTKGANRSNVMKDSLAFPNVQGSYFWWFGLCDEALKERIRAGLISCQFCWTCSSIVLFNWISWTKIIITSNADYESIHEKQIKLTMKASMRNRWCWLWKYQWETDKADYESINEKQMMLTMKVSMRNRWCWLWKYQWETDDADYESINKNRT